MSSRPRRLSILLLLGACGHGTAPAGPAAPSAPLVATVAQAPPATAPVGEDVVSYRLSPELQGDSVVALAVEMRFRGDGDGTTMLALPAAWADQRELWKNLYELKIEGATSEEVLDSKEPWKHTIHAPPYAPLIARYQVRSAYDGPPPSSVGQPFAPIITPTWFYAFGEALFATVERSGEGSEPARERTIRFAWEAPESLPFASDLQHLGDRTATAHDLLNSIVIGGAAVKVHTAAGAGNEGLRVAIAGDYRFASSAFIELAQAILIAQSDFFGQKGRRFLIAMSPLVPSSNVSIGGTSLADAFALSISQDTPLAELRETISHEHFHSWNPGELGAMREEADLRDKWFSEGFTNFYSSRLLQRSGRAAPEDFAESWNKALLAYATSPAREQPNSRIEKDYWNSQDVQKLAYHRGQLLAALWDYELRKASSGAKDLDDVILAMAAKVREAGAARAALPAPAELFAATYKAQGGTWIDEELDRHVRRGELIVLPEDAFGGCVTVKTRTQATFERGWDPEATSAADNVITGLAQDSPAYRAGLRDGMKILQRTAGAPGDATVRYELRVKDGAKERVIRFMPTGKGKVKAQRVEISSKLTAAEREACRKVLGSQ